MVLHIHAIEEIHTVNFEDICWLEALFDKMMEDARKVKSKRDVLAIIQERHNIIKEQKISIADGLLREC